MSSSENQWMAFEIPGQRFALPLANIASIFHLGNREEIGWLDDHLEVYEGVPVFLVAPHKLFQFNTDTAITEGTNQTLAWAIILKNSDDAHIGFRAAKTYGPFESELGADGLVRQGNLSIAVIQSVELA
jgi:hypothetical protein